MDGRVAEWLSGPTGLFPLYQSGMAQPQLRYQLVWRRANSPELQKGHSIVIVAK